jgi:acetylornithine deacetylase/succinyl-diaminopimelate desuccinylase-like protein
MTSLPAGNVLDWQAFGEEIVERFRAILRLNTSNPPGNETLVAEYLRSVLESEGIECTLVGPTPDRQSLIARLRGDGSAPPLLLMSHTDVVPAEADKWRFDPFGAEIDDGFIYARGTLDMKHMVAMELMVMLLLKRSGVQLKRDVIYMAAADEEAGGNMGAGWVADHYPELIQAEYALNEGGGECMEVNGRRYFTVQTAEKGGAAVRLRAHGKPGHASMPHDDNAIVKLGRVLAGLQGRQLPVHFNATFRAFIEGLAQGQPPEVASALRAVLADAAGADAALARLPLPESEKLYLNAMMRNTVTPTMLRAGSRVNVIPSVAEADLDCRILPGWTLERFHEELRTLIGDEIELESLVTNSPPLESDFASPLIDVIKEVLHEADEEAHVVPVLLTGGTDAKRIAHLGIQVFGFAPMLYEGEGSNDGIHGHNERISVRSMHWGTRVLYEVVARFVTQG